MLLIKDLWQDWSLFCQRWRMLVLLWDCTSCTRESGKKQWRQGPGKSRQQFQSARGLKWQSKETLSNSLLRANLSMSCSVTLISHAFPQINHGCFLLPRSQDSWSTIWCNVMEVFLCVILYPFIGWYSLFTKCIQGPPCLKIFHDFDWTCKWSAVTSLLRITATISTWTCADIFKGIVIM